MKTRRLGAPQSPGTGWRTRWHPTPSGGDWATAPQLLHFYLLQPAQQGALNNDNRFPVCQQNLNRCFGRPHDKRSESGFSECGRRRCDCPALAHMPHAFQQARQWFRQPNISPGRGLAGFQAILLRDAEFPPFLGLATCEAHWAEDVLTLRRRCSGSHVRAKGFCHR